MNDTNLFEHEYNNFKLNVVIKPELEWLNSISSDGDDGIIAVVSNIKEEIEYLSSKLEDNTWIYFFYIDGDTPMEKAAQQLLSYFYQVDEKMEESEVRYK